MFGDEVSSKCEDVNNQKVDLANINEYRLLEE